MKRMQRVFGDLDALMFVDGRLDEERRAAFLAHLAGEPRDASRVAVWARQNDVLRAAFAGIAAEPVPLWLRLDHIGSERTGRRDTAPPRDAARHAGAEIIRAPQRRATEMPTGAAAPARTPRRAASVGLSAVVLLAIGAFVIVAAHAVMPHASLADTAPARDEMSAPRGFIARAVDAHRTYAVDPVRPVEVPATQQAALDRWLQQRLGLALYAPDLHADGWTPIGGRLVPGEVGPAAFYLYENGVGERLGVTVAHAASGAATASLTLDPMAGGGAVLGWETGRIAVAVTTDRSLDWLSRNAETLRTRVLMALPPT